MEKFLINLDGIFQIKNDEYLYRYFPLKAFPKGQEKIPLDYFSDENLSCDWERLQKSPENSFLISQGKRAIVKIRICDKIRSPLGIDNCPLNQKVLHDPTVSNYSHSVIDGKKKLPVTKAIAESSELFKIVDE